MVAASTGLALAAGLLSQLSRFLMKNGDSLAEEVHVSCVVSGIAAAAVWIRGAGGKHRPTHLLALSRLRRVLCNLYYYIYFFASVTFGNKNELKKKKEKKSRAQIHKRRGASSEARKTTKSKSRARKRAGCEPSDVSFRSLLWRAQKKTPKSASAVSVSRGV